MSQTPRLAFAGALKAAVEENGTGGVIVYPPSFCLASGTPNVTLTNAIGTTETQFAFVTIKGGAMGPSSQLDIRTTITKAGAVAGDVRLKFGPASESFASATQFGGAGGLTTQVTTNNLAEIWNTGTLNSQLATPASVGSGLGAVTNAIVSGSVDTSLDWNIYFGWIYTASPTGGDSVTLRKFRVEIKN